MSNTYSIVTDSGVNLSEELIAKYQIKIVSLTFLVNDVELYAYQEGKDADLKKYYDLMRNKTKITTAAIAPDLAVNVIRPLLEKGEDVIYYSFSSALSASCQNANIAIESLKSEFPDRKILLVDTLNASSGQGLAVQEAAIKKEEGLSIDELYEWSLEFNKRIISLFTVDTLSYLYQGGRVSKASFWLADTIKLRPILKVDDAGKLVSLSKEFGRKRALLSMASKLVTHIVEPELHSVFISHADSLEDALLLKNAITEKMPTIKEIIITSVDLVIGAHSGPGTIALFFISDKRF
jgi:DegV family protein with EDD domain